MRPGKLYSIIFLYLVIIFTLYLASSLKKKNAAQVLKGQRDYIFAFFITIIAAYFIGMRPLRGGFGDSYFYAHTFNMYAIGMKDDIGASEWLWDKFTEICARTMDVHMYFTIIASVYFGFTFWACKRLFPNNVLVALLFNFAAFSFFTYSVNGLRNGVACSIILFVLALASGGNKEKIIALVIGFYAMAIHKSTILPYAMMIASMYFVKNFKWAYIFWLVSIIVSFVAGGYLENLFMGLGYDDRLDSYISGADDYAAEGYKSGFRWDFLLYSMMPIVLGYYVVIKRGIQDKTYLLLLNTYTLSNAIWVMLIRASYSNRFAYLSWFMYPMVLAYPLLRLDVWGKDQGKNAARIMLAHVGFTWFMSLI